MSQKHGCLVLQLSHCSVSTITDANFLFFHRETFFVLIVCICLNLWINVLILQIINMKWQSFTNSWKFKKFLQTKWIFMNTTFLVEILLWAIYEYISLDSVWEIKPNFFLVHEFQKVWTFVKRTTIFCFLNASIIFLELHLCKLHISAMVCMMIFFPVWQTL